MIHQKLQFYLTRPTYNHSAMTQTQNITRKIAKNTKLTKIASQNVFNVIRNFNYFKLKNPQAILRLIDSIIFLFYLINHLISIALAFSDTFTIINRLK